MSIVERCCSANSIVYWDCVVVEQGLLVHAVGLHLRVHGHSIDSYQQVVDGPMQMVQADAETFLGGCRASSSALGRFAGEQIRVEMVLSDQSKLQVTSVLLLEDDVRVLGGLQEFNAIACARELSSIRKGVQKEQ